MEATKASGEQLEKEIQLLAEQERFEPPKEFRERALLKDESIYDEAASDPVGFWERQADELIMRRLLRNIAEGEELGDVTTLREPGVMKDLESKFKDKEGEE